MASPRPLGFDFELNGDTIRFELATDAVEMTLGDFAREAMRLADDASQKAERAARESGRPVSCKKGCGACCRQLVSVSAGGSWLSMSLIRFLAALTTSRFLTPFELTNNARCLRSLVAP